MRERPRVLKTSTDAPAGPGRPMRGALYALAGAAGDLRGLQLWWVTTSAPGRGHGPADRGDPAPPGSSRHRSSASTRRASSGAHSASRCSALVHGKRPKPQGRRVRGAAGSNTFAVLSLLEGGKVLKHTVLLREGSTLAELAHAVEAEGLASAADVTARRPAIPLPHARSRSRRRPSRATSSRTPTSSSRACLRRRSSSAW